MLVEVVLLPRDLQPHHLSNRAVVVFDVLRATTSMVAALAAGVREIRIFGDTATALNACQAFEGPRLLCGEEKCLPPAGFDLGNSPGAFAAEKHADRVAFMSTTNGTRALLASRGATAVFIGALVNASATARALAQTGLDVSLLCAGTQGQVAMEDLIGAGAVVDALQHLRPVQLESDTASVARRLFAGAKQDLPAALRETRGGQNVVAAGLAPDIDFAARLDAFNIVGRASGEPPVIRAVSVV
ncbi:MAG: phosphosulfolactate phosphohydrolase-like enzyme [Phycisphaerales bacterium]|nr:phosphosulfolactate phosphohydrolase-like enzyme [Phycisphaerales bacterium]